MTEGSRQAVAVKWAINICGLKSIYLSENELGMVVCPLGWGYWEIAYLHKKEEEQKANWLYDNGGGIEEGNLASMLAGCFRPYFKGWGMTRNEPVRSILRVDLIRFGPSKDKHYDPEIFLNRLLAGDIPFLDPGPAPWLEKV